MKRIVLCIAVFLCLSSTHVYAANTTKEIRKILNRFKLFSNCQSMNLIVEKLSPSALQIGLTKDSIQNTAESRLRSARLFSNQVSDSFLYVRKKRVFALSQAYTIIVEFGKKVVDQFTGVSSFARTWQSGGAGIHRNDPTYLLSVLSKHMDKFLVEFFRVNDEACRQKK